MKSQNKLRILMIAPLPPPIHGSAIMTQYIKNSKLINASVDMDWINLSTSRRMDEIGKTTPIKVWRFVSSYAKTFFKLLIHKYDACYFAITCHGIGFLKDAPFVLMAKLLSRGKIIIHQHNKGMHHDVDRSIYRWLLPAVYNNATVILLSWRLYPDIEKVVKREQVTICPNGIPEIDCIKDKTDNEIPKLLFLSNLLVSKGVFVLLDACEILKTQGIKFNCRFVGGETTEIDKKCFENEVNKRALSDCVTYVGRKYDKEKDREFSNADIFILPTLNETFGLVLLEAMQQKTAVIGSCEGGIPDIISDGETGLIVKTNDAADLAEKIKILITNPEYRRQLGEQGYKKFKQNFTLENFEKNILDCLK